MMEDLVRLMVERWNLPENLVREFIVQDLKLNPHDISLEQLRTITADLVQTTILQAE